MDLFEHVSSDTESVRRNQPLAERIRPQKLSDIVGQSRQIGLDAPLRRQIETGQIPSLIIWGPPGCGKTTFARSLKEVGDFEFVATNAIETGAKALKEVGNQAHQRLRYHGKRTLLFVDEIHRLNKSQQDVLLPFVESGDIALIGATTENPSFEVNSALMSRCRLLRFERLENKELLELVDRAFEEMKSPRGSVLSDESVQSLIEISEGDARRMLNLLEIVHHDYSVNKNERDWPLTSEDLSSYYGAKSFLFSKNGDDRFDLISAFIKSIRGSSPDAGLYYLARLLAGGEDPNFIARRLVVLASEDIGNADPQGLVIATSAQQAVHLIGMPEAGIVLAQAVTYLASSPKSNRSYEAYQKASNEVSSTGSLPVPMNLRNSPTKMMKDLGYGKDYKYAHASSTGFQEMEFFPEGVVERSYYTPSPRGHELKIRKYFEWLKENS